MNKPHLVLTIGYHCDVDTLTKWVADHKIKVLNIAGPRDSQAPGIYEASFELLETLLSHVIKNISS